MSDVEYFRKRTEEEVRAAKNAQSAVAARVHLELAERYRALMEQFAQSLPS